MIFWQTGTGFLLLEFLTLILAIAKIGFFKTFFLCLLSAAIGGFLIQAQGLAVLAKAQQSFQRGGIPVSDVFQSLCVFIAGLLFILPGFISDIIGLALLIPTVRHHLKKAGATHFDLKEEGIIEGKYERVSDVVELLDNKPPQN